jgi:hypothetical protein
MPNSQPNACPPGRAVLYPAAGNYFFQKQGNHACIFYGTLQTNNAITAVATDFANRQVQCSLNNFATNPLCQVDLDQANRERPIRIVGNPVAFKITAMGLTWGGLSDINGNWQNPHAEHNNGKVIDIGFNDRRGIQMDDSRKLLLREVIRDNANYQSMPSCEGGTNLASPGRNAAGTGTCRSATLPNGHADHIHVTFAN